MFFCRDEQDHLERTSPAEVKMEFGVKSAGTRRYRSGPDESVQTVCECLKQQRASMASHFRDYTQFSSSRELLMTRGEESWHVLAFSSRSAFSMDGCGQMCPTQQDRCVQRNRNDVQIQ